MKKKMLWLGLAGILALSGCATVNKRDDLSNQALRNKVTALETQLTEKDNEILEAPECFTPPTRIHFEYGYIIYVPKSEDLPIDKYKEQGLSEAFIKIMQLAKEKDMDYVNIDRDGEEYEELEKFNW
jgi:hypothetical protein